MEKLLDEKRTQTFPFDKSEEEFLADFIKRTEQRELYWPSKANGILNKFIKDVSADLDKKMGAS